VAFADARSESPGESVARVRLYESDLPVPELQYEVWDGEHLVGRTDFAWEEYRTIGEFDGMIKYTTLLRPGENADDVLERQQAREDAFRRLGWTVIRWGWSDHADFSSIAQKLRQQFGN
jgi:hypothetical protein